jgi:citrate lyase beta subunit
MPNAIVLAGCGGLADLQAADVALGVVEAEAGVPAGQIGIIIVIGADPRGVLGCDTLAGGSRRLAGVVLDEDALASALGLRPDARRVSSAPLMLARGRAVLMAADAGVPSYCFLPAGEVQPAILAHLIRVAADDGFTTVAARGLAQWEALSGA